MELRDVLNQLDLGNAVAENDRALERYFVETSTFRLLVHDGADIIAGDKGTGKTALFQILSARYPTLPELHNVEVIAAFNPTGNPVFQRLTEGAVLSEGQYITIWKAYVLALLGNWLLELYEEAFTDAMFQMNDLLERVGLRVSDDSPSTVFSRIVNLFRKMMDPSAIEVSSTLSPQGIPVVSARVELRDDVPAEAPELVRHEDALALLNRALEEVDLSIWLVMDRLDEAFQGFPAAEAPALRALLRTYLDLNAFPRIRLKAVRSQGSVSSCD